MNSPANVVVPAFLAVSRVLTASVDAASSAGLSWVQLLRHPDLLPGECRLMRPMAFRDGSILAAGTTVVVLEVDWKEMLVRTKDARHVFAARPEETNILAKARAARVAGASRRA